MVGPDKETQPMHHHRHAIYILLIAATFGLGCNATSDPVDLGDNQTAVTGAALSDYAGEWEGYVEAFEFADGSDAIRLSLDAQGSGHILVGDSVVLPPPGPDESFSPYAWGGNAMTGYLLPGFDYSVNGAIVEDRRLRLAAASSEIYLEWCTLQTPVREPDPNDPTLPSFVPPDEPRYLCVPDYPLPPANLGPNGDTCSVEGPDGTVTADCGKWACLKVCGCNETECLPGHCKTTAYTECDDHLGDDARIDAMLQADGNELRGTLLMNAQKSAGVPRTIVMTRL
jgi:hypothetical protein